MSTSRTVGTFVVAVLAMGAFCFGALMEPGQASGAVRELSNVDAGGGAEEDDADDEEEAAVAWEELPEAVRAGFEHAVADSRPQDLTRETEGGLVVFEGSFDLNGKKLEVEVAENGALLETEEPVGPEELPAAVKESLGKRFPRCKIQGADRITMTFYEVRLRGLRTKEVRILGNGGLVED